MRILYYLNICKIEKYERLDGVVEARIITRIRVSSTLVKVKVILSVV